MPARLLVAERLWYIYLGTWGLIYLQAFEQATLGTPTATTPRVLPPIWLHTTKALAVLLHNSFRNIVHDHVDRRTADPPLPRADPRPTQTIHFFR